MSRYLLMLPTVAVLLPAVGGAAGIFHIATAAEGNTQRPPLEAPANADDCHIADTAPLFSVATAGKTYRRTQVEKQPLTWKETFSIDPPGVEVSITHRGCEDLSSVIELVFARRNLTKRDLLEGARDVLGRLEPRPAEGPVPLDLAGIAAWLGSEEARAAARIDHTACFQMVSDECIRDAYFSSPRANALVISYVDRP